jgi:hypothetical protein
MVNSRCSETTYVSWWNATNGEFCMKYSIFDYLFAGFVSLLVGAAIATPSRTSTCTMNRLPGTGPVITSYFGCGGTCDNSQACNTRRTVGSTAFLYCECGIFVPNAICDTLIHFTQEPQGYIIHSIECTTNPEECFANNGCQVGTGVAVCECP